ncbi:hypothetical protein CBR_g58154 [Chara braunii]|uniref:Serine/threonine-protein phosphatase n=1 Tax=Chara braunii TaxID=69332 RepID=A0A388MEM5_CHABU|nr:hypothetical protein CBR_g58154 [Chara braunii]|eukprot:GBG93016.1 hypothetical protein CBR_g58154 [Chara braunii]
MSKLDAATRSMPPDELRLVLPAQVVEEILSAASKTMAAEPNLVDIRVTEYTQATPEPWCRCVPIPAGCTGGPVGDPRIHVCAGAKQVTLVGDLHGQYHDFLQLLEKAGEPSEDSVIVFNGDYVDRGAWGLETYVTLLAWKILLPNRVFLLRGNHETRFCSTSYGFKREVETKYGAHSRHLFQKFLSTFTSHPLAAVVASSVLVCHGGLWRELHPSRRKGAKNGGKKKDGGRKNGVPEGDRSLRVGSLEDLMKVRRTVQDPSGTGMSAILGDILWSDPSSEPGLKPNDGRGIGLLFGPDITEEFLEKNHLRLIVRSHEGPDAREQRPDMLPMSHGYTVDHTVKSGKLMTLFSAPDYPQFQVMDKRFENKAAFFVLTAPDFWEPQIYTLDAVLPRPQVHAYYEVMSYMDSDDEMDAGKGHASDAE